jgi:hypothetical protein
MFDPALRAHLTELSRGKLDQDDREAIKKDGVFWRQTRSGKTIGIDPDDGSIDAGHPKVLKKLKKAGKAIGKSSFAKGAKAGFKKATSHGHDDDHGDEPKGFFGKLKAKGKAVASVFSSMPGAAKKLFTDKEHRKKVLSKKTLTKGASSVAEFAGKAAGRFVGHMAHEGIQAKHAAKALWKIKDTKVSDLPKTWKSLSKEDKKAIKGTAKAIAMTVGGTAAMGHFGVLALVEHFVAESAIVGAVMAHRSRFGAVLTEAEAEAQMAKVLEHVINRLDDVSGMSDDELAKLFSSVMEYRGKQEESLQESKMTPEQAYERVKYAWTRYGEAHGWKGQAKRGWPEFHELTKDHIKLASKFARDSKHPGKIHYMKMIRKEFRDYPRKKSEATMHDQDYHGQMRGMLARHEESAAADPMHQFRTLAGIRPTQLSLTEARSGITEHERQAQRDRTIDRSLDEGYYFDPGDFWVQTFRGGDQVWFAPLAMQKNGGVKGLLLDVGRRKVKKSSVWKSNIPGKSGALWKKGDPPDSIKKYFRAHSDFQESVDEGKSLKHRIKDAEKHAKMDPKSGWGKHLRKLKKKVRGEEVEEGKRPTFKAARAALLDHLEKEGWTVKKHLKVPHATDHWKENRLYFKAQAVYLGGGHPGASLGDARSLHIDIRDVTPEQFMQHVKRWTR